MPFLPAGTKLANPDPWVLREPRDLNPLQLASPIAHPGREQLQPLVIGSPEGVRATINLLHVLTYAEQATGRQLITIPPSGILMTPE